MPPRFVFPLRESARLAGRLILRLALRGRPACVASAALLVLAACSATGPAGDKAASPAAPAAAAHPATPLSGAAPLTLEDADAEAAADALRARLGKARAEIVLTWSRRIAHDPEIQRSFGADGLNRLGGAMLRHPERFTEGALRLTPEDRSTFMEIGVRILDAAPADCGGVKNMSVAILRNLSFERMSAHDLDDYFRITYDSLKRIAENAPVATVTEAQREAGRRALSAAIARRLHDDPGAARALAGALADPVHVSAEDWCSNMRSLQHALLDIPQPQRDWLLISIQTDVRNAQRANRP